MNFKMYLYLIMTSGLIRKLPQVAFILERRSFVLEKGDLEKSKLGGYYLFYYLLLTDCIFSGFAGKVVTADTVKA